MTASLLVLLHGCAYLVEQRTEETEVRWSGWVLMDLPSQDAVEMLTAGTVEFSDEKGDPIVLSDGTTAEATQPYADSPGWWEVVVPVDTEVTVRVAGAEDADPAMATMVWRGRSPSGRGFWLDGAFFTREADYYDAFFLLIDDLPGVDPAPLAQGEVAHLWGEPIDPEAWAGADIEVTDAEGVQAQVIAFAVDEDGSLVESDAQVDLFVAINLPPGTTTLTVTTAGGDRVSTAWPTQGGDLLSAYYYALPGG